MGTTPAWAAGWWGTPTRLRKSQGHGLTHRWDGSARAVGQRDRGMSLRQRDPAELGRWLPWVRASSYPCSTAPPPRSEVLLGAASHGCSPNPAPQTQLLPGPKPHFDSKNSSFSPAGSLRWQLGGCLKRPWGCFAAPLTFPPTPSSLLSCPLPVTQPVAHPRGTVAPGVPLGIGPSLGKCNPPC